MSALLFWLLFSVSLAVFVLGLVKIRQGKAFERVWWLLPWGAFVWGDAPLFGFFWALILAVVQLLDDLLLLGVLTALFWLVRSLGEVVYWLHEQFTPVHRNPPEKLFGYRLFKNESIWFVYQIFWQCLAVTALFFSVWFFHLWLGE